MKKEKGFTLIELLAVIVILTIITVIAIPKVLDVVNKSKDSAANSSLKLVKDAIKTQVSSSDLTGDSFIKESDGCYIFNFDDQNTGNSKKLNIKNKNKITGSIKYCNNTFTDDTLKFDGMSNDSTSTKVICKRAKILHTEECKETDSNLYCSGAGYTTSGSKGTTTITYGNLGTTGTLTSGDAFDCDVNGDGIYNPDTERFYYVSDYYDTNTNEFNSSAAALIYYSSVNGDAEDNNNSYEYDEKNTTSYGPRTASLHLPTTNQWKNVKLINSTRNLSITETATNFSYTGYAARLLARSELEKNCGSFGQMFTGELDSCTYLLENTRYSYSKVSPYGYWIEAYSDFEYGMGINGSGRDLSTDIPAACSGTCMGVRPVIDVLKANMEY